MNRLHVHLHVRDIAQSVRFYSALFGSQPTRLESDYAKWMLDDPRVNFAISARGGEAGLGHLGIQVESETELEAVSERAKNAAGEVLIEKGATCCYARGEKSWAEDPQGVRWETFLTTGDLTTFGVGADEVRREGATKPASACCGPAAPAIAEAPKTTTACCG
ncbi:MAG: glyoxalase/bleomycin resistance/dioxygenase family protein [Alphaproteobacteria bacterium]|nr:glyoxalase/bleomycin resistance/dioxygenase family protein [Alphaproteobacteria bacterium]